MQPTPDWTRIYSPAGFEQDFADGRDPYLQLHFAGPGLYLGRTDTLLVTPVPPDAPATRENCWHIEQPAGTLYSVSVWNAPLDQTICTFFTGIPTRYDWHEHTT